MGRWMKILVILCYILAGFLALLGVIMLFQILAARQAVENATLGYQILLGVNKSVIDSLVRGAQALLCLAAGLFLGGGGLFYAFARLMVRLNQQNLRIQELEAELRTKTVAASDLPDS
jgi:hypothetical protein